MRKVLFSLLILCCFSVKAQVYNNEWIDFSKTYYKFKVGRTGLYRIPQATLTTSGLGSTDAQHFQLWRNGVQVPIYTSVTTGSLSSADYIEFWGEMNDGKVDKQLYRQPENQLNDKWSLSTDTAVYFLTINPNGSNLRLATTQNNIAGNTLSPEPFFMYTIGKYYKDRLNSGFAVDVTEYMYSSSYDRGEGWTSTEMGANGTLSFNFQNLFVYSSGPAAKLNIALSGNAIRERSYKLSVNGDSVFGKTLNFFNTTKDTTEVALAKLSSDNATITVNISTVECLPPPAPCRSDKSVIHKSELTYPRQFNFGGAANFEFSLPATSVGNYLEISGFSYGSIAPVLYDLTNGKRYVADITNPALLKFALEPSASKRNLVLVNQETQNATSINSLQSRSFTNFSLAQNAGDFLIISNPILMIGSGNPVENYRAYRSSTAGGSFNTKIFLIEDLTDQFAFGIKKNPLSIRNFMMYARANFPVQPKHLLLMGKGVHYVHQRNNEHNADIERLNLVPTFGWPASDVLLTADPGDSYPKTSVGRLSVVTPQEVSDYLKKLKDFEAAQQQSSPLIQDKAWMKNVVHAVGASEPGLQASLDNYMTKYGKIISDTAYGANVTTFTKTSAEAVQQINNGALDRLFEEGISLITYFGHSSASTLEFNLNNPSNYNNFGKYPLFIALGCNAGNFYNFGTARFSAKEALSEKFVLAPDRGTIGFIASSHFGIVHYLDIWATRFYTSLSSKDYGKPLGELMQSAIAQTFSYASQNDFYARANSEETILHGDPAIIINTHPKPDYVVEDPLVKINPGFISIADQSFNVKAKFLNIGKAINDSLVIEIKRQYPNNVIEVVHRETIRGIRYADSIDVDIPVDAIRDKGLNKIIITVDADNKVSELYETNNTVTKEFFIYEDEARPVYPYNFSIINKQNIKLLASTANPLSPSKTYKMEIDTTELFNSPLKVNNTVTSVGGTLEFSPGITFTDSTVYYWRVAQVTSSGPVKWNTSSFIYLPNHDAGFNQSHIYQHFKSEKNKLLLDSSTRKWTFSNVLNDIFITHGTWGSSTGQESGMGVLVNNEREIYNACSFRSLVFNVFDPLTFEPWENPLGGLYGSLSNTCFRGRQNNFEFRYTDTASRRQIMEFMENIIPDGYYVIVRVFNTSSGTPNQYAPAWMADTSLYGSNKSLYHYIKNAGLTSIDSFNKIRPWALVYKKNDHSYTPRWEMGEGIFDNITLSTTLNSSGTSGSLTSPTFGPAVAWKEFRWKGSSTDPVPSDEVAFNVIGIQNNGTIDTLIKNIPLSQQVVNISAINPQQYPFLKLHMSTSDTTYYTPFQLKTWQLTYVPAPEGAVAPNILFTLKDTLEVGEPIDFKLAFRNVTDINFSDSLKIKMILTDRNNISHVLPIQRHKILMANDTLHVSFPIKTEHLVGYNTLYVEVNPDKDQPEQYQFNNFIHKNFFVKGDTLNPLLDVTFDHVHILNGDVVSAKPDILIKLKDEAKWMMLDDTSLVNVQVVDPDFVVTRYYFNSDTLEFTPASGTNNTATIQFNPQFMKDGNYELIVSGKDKSSNTAGNIEYRVGFKVVNKPMISNMLNYPNPFTTSTAFVFTITGSEVPQNFKIQILTVTGKIVREITKAELGPLRVGKNITEYKWDGTDQYGQKLANGVYLYRVITSLNGKSLEKYRSEGENTDKFFNKGYGKMYLMR